MNNNGNMNEACGFETSTSTANTSESEPNSARACIPLDIAQGLEDQPIQPQNFEFTKNGRSFNSSWFTKHAWLEYSVSRDAAFCYPVDTPNNRKSNTTRTNLLLCRLPCSVYSRMFELFISKLNSSYLLSSWCFCFYFCNKVSPSSALSIHKSL